MKFIFVEPYDRGGLVHYTHDLANATADLGHQVKFYASANIEIAEARRSYDLVPRFNIDRSDRELLGASGASNRFRRLKRRLRGLRDFLSQYSKLAMELKRQNPDYVVVGTIFRYPAMALFVRYLDRQGIRVLQICHEFQNRTGAGGLITTVLKRANRFGYGAMHRIYFLSSHLRNEFAATHSEVDPNRLCVIPIGNGRLFEELATEQARDEVLTAFGIAPDRPYLLFYGRIREDKGVLDLVEAFARLQKRYPLPHALVFLGAGPAELLTEIKRIAHNNGLDSAVSVCNGYYETSKLWPIVQSAAVTIFPYRSGSQSAALQVALYAGRPIVASDVGGIPEVIQEAENGLLFPAGDTKALEDVLHRLLIDEELSDRIARGAAHSAQTEHSWRNVASSLVSQLGDQAECFDSLPSTGDSCRQVSEEAHG